MRTIAFYSLLLSFPGTLLPADSARIEFDALRPALLQERLERVSRKLPERRETLESLFQEAGCKGDRLIAQPVPRSKQPNVICTLPGEGRGTIVVGAHFDLVSKGMGVVDNWSGAALLPSLYQSLASKPRRHRIVFIGFAAEEEGLYGSTEYLKKLSNEEKASVRAMINLECLGVSQPKVWATRADKGLLDAYLRVVNALHLLPAAVNVDKVGDDDSRPFLNAKMPVITIHSIDQESLPILHSARDNLEAIHADDYYAAYRLVGTYLAYLDSWLP